MAKSLACPGCGWSMETDDDEAYVCLYCHETDEHPVHD